MAGAPTPTSTPRTAGLTPDVLRLLRAGAEQHERGRLREAEAIYKDALAAAPHSPEVLHLVGLVTYQLGRPHDAVIHLERAVAADGLVAAYHDNLGLALRAMGRIEEAATAHRQAAVLDRHTPGAHFNLGAALQSLGRHEDAIAAFRRALAIAPDYPEVHNAIAASFARTGKNELALSHVRRALATRPGFADAHVTIANILASQDRLDEARAHYAEALKLEPSNPDARRSVALILFQMQDFAGAADAVRAALDGPDADLLHIGAESARRLGRLEESETLYRRLCAATPRSADALRGLAGVLFERGTFEDARDAYQAVLAIDPACAISRAQIAAIDSKQETGR